MEEWRSWQDCVNETDTCELMWWMVKSGEGQVNRSILPYFVVVEKIRMIIFGTNDDVLECIVSSKH